MFQEIRHVHTSKGLFYDVNPKKNIGIFRPKNHGGKNLLALGTFITATWRRQCGAMPILMGCWYHKIAPFTSVLYSLMYDNVWLYDHLVEFLGYTHFQTNRVQYSPTGFLGLHACLLTCSFSEGVRLGQIAKTLLMSKSGWMLINIS